MVVGWLPWLLAEMLGAHGLAAQADEAKAVACPPGVSAQIEGLYRWHLAHQVMPGPLDFSSQRQRFTTVLYADLQKATALTPTDGRFIDFDPLSGTQVSTFGAKVLGCSGDQPKQREAIVAVQAGLRQRIAEAPQRLRFRLEQQADGNWRIADIRYPGDPGFQLSDYLQELLKPRGD